jgi:hypothetical protein
LSFPLLLQDCMPWEAFATKWRVQQFGPVKI